MTARFERLIVTLVLAAGFATAFWWLWLPERQRFYSFAEAGKLLLEQVLYDMPQTLYCGAGFDGSKNIYPLSGFQSGKYGQLAEKMTWEHVVPVSRFGRTFVEWREGHRECVANGKRYKGRKCAAKVNDEFVRMEGDMYNIFPAIGAVNSARGAREYAELGLSAPAFGSCRVLLAAKKMEPPDSAKGVVARASLYMAERYPRLKWSEKQRKMFEAWNDAFPVEREECVRTKRIERLQRNENRFVKEPCKAAGLW